MSSIVFFGDKSEHSVAKTGEITKNDVKPSGRATSYAYFASPLKFLKSVRRSIAPQSPVSTKLTVGIFGGLGLYRESA